MSPHPKSLLTLCLVTALLMLPAPMSARKMVFDLSEYGITPNAPDDYSLTTRIGAALTDIQKKAKGCDKTVLKLKRGIYHLHALYAPCHELYISNHDQGQPKRVGIYIKEWKGLAIEGDGAEIVCHGRMLPLALEGTEQFEMRSLSIDFDDPQIAQVQVLKNSPSDGITFEIAPWVNYRIAPNGRLETYGEGWEMQQDAGMAFERDTRHIVYCTSDISVNLQGLKDLGGNQMYAPQWKDERLAPGTVVALRSYERPAPAIFLNNCTDTKITNVIVHYAEGMGILAQRCTNITLKKFSVCLRGEEDPRYFTTQADATHFVQCRGKITVRGGLYENMMDDAINVHGIYLRVSERIDDHTLRCTFGHNQAWGFSWGDAGDTVRFVRSATMKDAGHQNLIASIRPDGQDSVKGCKGFVVTMRERLPEEMRGGNLFGIENLSWTPEVNFSRNTVRNNRARGALFSSPRHTVCQDNLFDHTSGSAILLCGDCNGWFESGAVRDLVIRRNTFINALTSQYQFTNAVISICPEIPRLADQQNFFHGGCPAAIRIEHNVFDTFDTPLLYAKSVSGLIFRKNQIRKNNEYPPYHFNTKTIETEHCEKTKIEW